jgi:hypothetical protein
MIPTSSETPSRPANPPRGAAAVGVSLHLVGTYLSLTENWLYRRLQGLTRYPPVVLARELRDAELYPLERVGVLGTHQFPRWRRALHRLGRVVSSRFKPYYRQLSESKPSIVHSHFAPLAVKLRDLRTLARQLFGCPTVCSF